MTGFALLVWVVCLICSAMFAGLGIGRGDGRALLVSLGCALVGYAWLWVAVA